MHERALTSSIAATALRSLPVGVLDTPEVAAATAGVVVHVEVGALSGVVPAAVVHSWPEAVAGTPLAASMLDVRLVRPRLACRRCRQQRDTDDELACSVCGGTAGELQGGEGVRVVSITVPAEAATDG